MPPKKSFSELQAERKARALPPVHQTNIPASQVAVPISVSPVFDQFTPEMMVVMKEKIKEDKIAEQKAKKRDYQREYMRKYKKDTPLSEDEKLKKKIKRSLGGIDPEKLKPIVAELLGV